MKKPFAFLTALALAFMLCACAAAPDAAQTPSPTPGVDPTPTASGPDSGEELEALLDDFATHIQAGSAGSSLKAVAQAVRLMDWGAATDMTDEEIQAAASGYLAALDEGAREEYLMQIEALDYAYQQLLQPNQEELLETAGCGDAAYPWSETPIPAVESLMAALGRRDGSGG